MFHHHAHVLPELRGHTVSLPCTDSYSGVTPEILGLFGELMYRVHLACLCHGNLCDSGIMASTVDSDFSIVFPAVTKPLNNYSVHPCSLRPVCLHGSEVDPWPWQTTCPNFVGHRVSSLIIMSGEV
jgi:hypothetical protein